jgi:hypothetical protein
MGTNIDQWEYIGLGWIGMIGGMKRNDEVGGNMDRYLGVWLFIVG